jgi:hypothetical protein
MSWWQLAVLIAACALILGALWLLRWGLNRLQDERAVSAEAERYVRRAAAGDEAEMAVWEEVIQSINADYGPDWREP